MSDQPETEITEESVQVEETAVVESSEREEKLASYRSAHRMLLYLLMTLVVLELAGIPSWAIMPAFVLFLWSDHGESIVGLQEKGWSNTKIALRMLIDVIPVSLVIIAAVTLWPSPWLVGILSGASLLFYIVNRHRLMRFAVS